MALEKRGGNLYYYRSIRDGDKVRKVYVGAGEHSVCVVEGEHEPTAQYHRPAEIGRAHV